MTREIPLSLTTGFRCCSNHGQKDNCLPVGEHPGVPPPPDKDISFEVANDELVSVLLAGWLQNPARVLRPFRACPSAAI